MDNIDKKRIGGDELNLIEIPVFTLTTRKTKENNIIKVNWSNPDGSIPTFEIIGNPIYGLPDATARDVYMACMELTHALNYERRKVKANKHELIKLLGWTDKGESYKRLIKAFDQLSSVRIKKDKFYEKETGRCITQSFGVIGGYKFYDKHSKPCDSIHPGQGYFRWDEDFFNKSLQFRNIIPINTRVYFSFHNSISKALFSYLNQRLYNHNEHEYDLYNLAYDTIGMSKYKYPSFVINKLMPGINEINDRKIAVITVLKSQTLSGYKVRFEKPGNVKKAIEVKQAKKLVTDTLVYTTQKGRPPFKSEIELSDKAIKKHGLAKAKEILRIALLNFKKSDYLERVKSFIIFDSRL